MLTPSQYVMYCLGFRFPAGLPYSSPAQIDNIPELTYNYVLGFDADRYPVYRFSQPEVVGSSQIFQTVNEELAVFPAVFVLRTGSTSASSFDSASDDKHTFTALVYSTESQEECDAILQEIIRRLDGFARGFAPESRLGSFVENQNLPFEPDPRLFSSAVSFQVAV